MSLVRVSQGHKVGVVVGGDPAPVRVAQAHKILLFSPGTSPARVAQAHKIIVFTPGIAPAISQGRRNFMGFVP
jgi:hypothetical protein